MSQTDLIHFANQSKQKFTKTTRSGGSDENDNNNNTQSSSRLSLTQGDLPGYTGWGRPSWTTAPWYKVVYPSTTTPQAGIPFKLKIVCRGGDEQVQQKCNSFHALFYVRAYGPTVLTGTVERRVEQSSNSAEYEVTFLFFEPGDYVIEIVVAFSDVPPIEEFPLTTNEPAYEGYLLPEMPSILKVYGTSLFHQKNATQKQRTCQFDDIYESSTTSALERGTWVLRTKVATAKVSSEININKQNFSFEGYQTGKNSLGFSMQYKPSNCDLLPIKDVVMALKALKQSGDVHIVFMGDSNMLAQHDRFNSILGRDIAKSYLSTHGGLHLSLPQLKKDLENLSRTAAKNKTKRYFLVFNAGLHDLDKHCAQSWSGFRKQNNITSSDKNFSCIHEYRDNMEKLIQLVKDVPFELRFFLSTTAGWLKWGNYGFAWPSERQQKYPVDSHVCGIFNEVAWEMMQDHNIPFLDTYWLSLSRPDHTQIQRGGKIGGKMVHLGVEIYDVLLRKYLSLILLSLSTDSA